MAIISKPRIICPQIRQAVLEQKDYHHADELCQKMQGLFAEAYQVIGSLHVDCDHPGAVTEYRRELDIAIGASRRRATRWATSSLSARRFPPRPIRRLCSALPPANLAQLNATIWMDGALVKSVKAVGGNRLLLTGKAPKHVAGAGHPGSEKPVVLSDVPGEGMYYAAVLEVRAGRRPRFAHRRQARRRRRDGAARLC